MEYSNFENIVSKSKSLIQKRRGVVAAAEDEHVLQAAFKAAQEGILFPILTGNKQRIKNLIVNLGFQNENYELVESDEGEYAAQKAVDVINSGDADFIIKGRIETKDLLKPIVKKENNLHIGRIISHLVVYQIPNYHKLIFHSDGGMVVYPDLNAKKEITLNAVETLNRLGYACPKVAIMCGVEKFNPKMQETVDARDLAEMNARSEIPNCLIEGPISYDVAMSKEIAEIKGYPNENCGNFDLMIMPNLVSGNLLGKALCVSAGALLAGIVVGAKVPIVLTSRGSSAEEKFNSIALCVLASAVQNSNN